MKNQQNNALIRCPFYNNVVVEKRESGRRMSQSFWFLRRAITLVNRIPSVEDVLNPIKAYRERRVTGTVSNYTVDLFNVAAAPRARSSCGTHAALYVFHGALQ